MARYEDVINSFTGGGGAPQGGPVPSQVPGAPPSPSQPGMPTTPQVNSAPAGRPVGSGGPPMPMAPQIPDVQPPQKLSQESEVASMESQKNVNPGPQVVMLNRLPRPGDLLDLPPGITVRTPYGDLDEEGNIKTSPEYEQKHKEAIAKARQKFGPTPWGGMAGAPEPNIILGKSFFNPFTRSFGRAE
jgi:hypothetical protein